MQTRSTRIEDGITPTGTGICQEGLGGCGAGGRDGEGAYKVACPEVWFA